MDLSKIQTTIDAKPKLIKRADLQKHAKRDKGVLVVSFCRSEVFFCDSWLLCLHGGSSARDRSGTKWDRWGVSACLAGAAQR